MNNPKWVLPADLISESVSIMRPHGKLGNEGLALWFATGPESRIEITHVIEPVGPGFQTTPLYMRLSLSAMSTLTDLAEKLGAYLAGQIHSHPEQLLELSSLDKRHGLRSQNYLSAVCPYYAQRQPTSLRDCGVHVYQGNDYRRIPTRDLDRYVEISNSRVNKIVCQVNA